MSFPPVALVSDFDMWWKMRNTGYILDA